MSRAATAAMPSLRSCDQLRREHRLIGRVVGGLEALAERHREGVDVPMLPVTGAVDFFASFVACCHDVKEHEALFPALAASGATEAALMEMLRHDHDEGERLLGTLRPLSLRARLNDEAWPVLEAYLALLRRHIAREEGELLPLAERLLSVEDDAAIERAFARIEERTLGRAGSDALVALAAAVADAADAMAAQRPGVRAGLVAREIMRPRPATVAPGDSLARAADVMGSCHARELPVVDGGTLVGIVTRTDMEPLRGHYEWTAVRTVMTPDPVTVGPETAVAAVARLLLGRGFNAVPVAAGPELLGMIGRADVLKVLGPPD